MVYRSICNFAITCALVWSIAGYCFGQEEPTKKAPGTSLNTPSGAELFNLHCAVCHGADLKGSGPFPPPYRKPPDLTTLTWRHGGKFPSAYVSSVLRNGVKLPAHGPAEMPIWGAEFETTQQLDKTQVAARIRNLTDYIKSLQQK